MNLSKACIVGAGASGLAAARAFRRQNIEFDCFEKGDRPGGMWVFNNTSGLSVAYRSLHLNSSRDRSGYQEYPMPKEFPDFPHHTKVADYLYQYAEHFELLPSITFKTSVLGADRSLSGWRVRLSTGESRDYDALIVATGHHWDPRWPSPPYPGTFNGTQIHSSEFRDARRFDGNNVVIVGMGNSAMDIASECSILAKQTYLVARRGAHIVPKYLLGRTLDNFPIRAWIPWRVRQFVLNGILKIQVGPIESYGLPKPLHGPAQAHPTVSSDILTRLGQGQVIAKPEIERFEGNIVVFADQSRIEAEAVIYCTGYNVALPFLGGEERREIEEAVRANRLFMRMVHPSVENLFLVGFIQPLGALIPIVEAQAKLVAGWVSGLYMPPSEKALKKVIALDVRNNRNRYVKSPRHALEVDAAEYLHAVEVEIRRGIRRARPRW